MTYWVYILSSKPLGPLYVGVTNDLFRRVGEHKRKDLPGFTNAMESTDFYRGYGEVTEAIHFEKQLKRWRRDWKIRLIEEDNPHWADLYPPMAQIDPIDPAIMGPGLSLRENRDDS